MSLKVDKDNIVYRGNHNELYALSKSLRGLGIRGPEEVKDYDSIYLNLSDYDWGAISPKSYWFSWYIKDDKTHELSYEGMLDIIADLRGKKSKTFKDNNTLGSKESDGKLNYELDWEFLSAMAERMSKNKSKYLPYNWKKPIDIEPLKQSLFRHVIEVMKGNYKDEDDELGHLTAISLNAMFLNYQIKNNE